MKRSKHPPMNWSSKSEGDCKNEYSLSSPLLIFFQGSCSIRPLVSCIWNIGRDILWQYGLLRFPGWDTKLKRFLVKNQHTQRKILYFVNWCSSQKYQNWIFKVNFLCQKLSESFIFSKLIIWIQEQIFWNWHF